MYDSKRDDYKNGEEEEMNGRVFRCKWCQKEFLRKGEAYRHAVTCNMEFVINDRQAKIDEKVEDWREEECEYE